jgi:hypothetical protein
VHNDNSSPIVKVAGRPVRAPVDPDDSSSILSTYWNER